MMLDKFQHTKCDLPPWRPNADFDWIQNSSGLPWLRLEISIPADTILKEISNIIPLLVEHREQYNEHQGWKSFCIHGKSYDATRESGHYNDQRPYVWTKEAQTHMPKTVEFFRTQWPHDQFQRVRVMLLEPGGYISLHKDSDQSKLTAVNMALTQPNGCDFVMEQHGKVPFSSGTAFWLDLSNRHVVFNHSKEPRWHIIVHQTFNQSFHDMVAKSYKNLYNELDENCHNYHT